MANPHTFLQQLVWLFIFFSRLGWPTKITAFSEVWLNIHMKYVLILILSETDVILNAPWQQSGILCVFSIIPSGHNDLRDKCYMQRFYRIPWWLQWCNKIVTGRFLISWYLDFSCKKKYFAIKYAQFLVGLVIC